MGDLKEVSLSVGRPVGEPGAGTGEVYFPTSGVISIVVKFSDGRMVESLTVGREGAIGLVGAFGSPGIGAHSVVQIAGAALKIRASAMRAAARKDPSIYAVVTRYAQFIVAQLNRTAACNALHTVEERLCRWLLAYEDRLGDCVVPLTHADLAILLGVPRPRVTLVAQTLRQQGLIGYRRGRITLLDRCGVEQKACECFESTQSLYARIFADGPPFDFGK
jgi:CRP-like cAMP-binding protein